MDTSPDGPSAASSASAAVAASSTSATATMAVSSPSPLSSSSSRPDGRLPTELRPISVEHGLLQRADGSCSWSQGGSIALAGVYGPILAGGKDERMDRATIVVHFKSASGSATNIDMERGSYIRQCLESVLLLHLHPRCKISIDLQLIRDGGSILSVALNAAIMACMDAGLSCSSMMGSVCIAMREEDTQNAAKRDTSKPSIAATPTASSSTSNSNSTSMCLLDPIDEEEEDGHPIVTFAFTSTSPGALLSVIEHGCLNEAMYFDALEMGREACSHVLQFMRMAMEKAQAQNQ